MARQKARLQKLVKRTEALMDRISAAGELSQRQFYKFMLEYNRIDWKINRLTGGGIERSQIISGITGNGELREPLLQIARAQYQIAQAVTEYSGFAQAIKENSRKWDKPLRIAGIAYRPTIMLVASMPFIEMAWNRFAPFARTLGASAGTWKGSFPQALGRVLEKLLSLLPDMHVFSPQNFMLTWYGLFLGVFLVMGIPATLATKARNMSEVAEAHAKMGNMENPDGRETPG